MTAQPEIIERQPNSTAQSTAANGSPTRLSGTVRFAQAAFMYLAFAFTLCVVIQVFLAGLAVFVSPLNWVRHINFVHVFEFVPLLMLLLSFVGRLPKALRWQSAGLFGGIFFQYFSANIGSKLPWAAALHPVMAMMIFWLAITVARNSWRVIFRARQGL